MSLREDMNKAAKIGRIAAKKKNAKKTLQKISDLSDEGYGSWVAHRIYVWPSTIQILEQEGFTLEYKDGFLRTDNVTITWDSDLPVKYKQGYI